jgi:hypothetical protein
MQQNQKLRQIGGPFAIPSHDSWLAAQPLDIVVTLSEWAV